MPKKRYLGTSNNIKPNFPKKEKWPMKIWKCRQINLLNKLSLSSIRKQSDGCCKYFHQAKPFTPLRIVDQDLFRRNDKYSSALIYSFFVMVFLRYS